MHDSPKEMFVTTKKETKYLQHAISRLFIYSIQSVLILPGISLPLTKCDTQPNQTRHGSGNKLAINTPD